MKTNIKVFCIKDHNAGYKKGEMYYGHEIIPFSVRNNYTERGISYRIQVDNITSLYFFDEYLKEDMVFKNYFETISDRRKKKIELILNDIG